MTDPPKTHACINCGRTGEGTLHRMPSQWSQSRCPKCHVKRKGRAHYRIGGSGKRTPPVKPKETP